jgi:hypothetical protein
MIVVAPCTPFASFFRLQLSLLVKSPGQSTDTIEQEVNIHHGERQSWVCMDCMEIVGKNRRAWRRSSMNVRCRREGSQPRCMDSSSKKYLLPARKLNEADVASITNNNLLPNLTVSVNRRELRRSIATSPHFHDTDCAYSTIRTVLRRSSRPSIRTPTASSIPTK